MSYRHRGIDFPSKEGAMAWEENQRLAQEADNYSREHPLSDEEWKAECRRVREYGIKRKSRRQDSPSAVSRKRQEGYGSRNA